MRKQLLVGSAVAALATFGASATNANATATLGQPVVNSSNTAMSVTGVMEVKSQYDYVGTYISVAKSKVNTKQCFWASGTWTNSFYLDGTTFKWYSETSRAKFCKLKHTIKKGGRNWKYVKVAGGKTGKPCYNLAIPPAFKQPKPQLKGSFMDYKELQYNVTYELKGSAALSAQATCATASGSASATAIGNGSFSSTVTVQVKAKSRAEASASGATKVSLEQKQDVQIAAQGKAQLDLVANANVRCDTIVTPKTPTCEETGTCPPPPTCEDRGDCPPPKRDVSAKCDGLIVNDDLTRARAIRVTVNYTAVNTTLTGVKFYWDDGSSDATSGTTATHQYTAAGNYSVYAVLSFKDYNGNVHDVTCTAEKHTAKDGSSGLGGTTPGIPGGSGSGGKNDGDPNNGAVCRNESGDTVTGTSDQFGNCVSNAKSV